MQVRSRAVFSTIRTEGALLPADLLEQVARANKELGGLRPVEDYYLAPSEKLGEAASRAWQRLLGFWSAFKAKKDTLTNEPATALTRERWLLPLFGELGYGRLVSAAKAVEVGEKSYAISHFWQQTPIHLVGCGVGLDARTAGVAGAAKISPHSLVQELLNRSNTHLWGFVSNGLKLRILRDNVSLTRQAFVEFDLESMMEGGIYPDFALLWLLCHQSRVEAEKPEDCWLEKWSREAGRRGTRALDQLRKGVEEAIACLGQGYLAHPANQGLREKLHSGGLSNLDYYRQLLRLVYRLLFLFVAEDRDVLHGPAVEAAARERYARFYSTVRLRQLAQRRRGTVHADLWQGLRLVMEQLNNPAGCPALGLHPLGSFLWSQAAVAAVAECEIANRDLLAAVRAIAFTEDQKVLRSVDFKNLGSEELGSVYESLLELHPELNVPGRTFNLQSVSGNERKTTGSYYTPASLIQCPFKFEVQQHLTELRIPPVVSDNQALFAGGH